jgi:transposase
VPGQRVENDRADAERPARLLRAGELVAVAVPARADEGARDLVRARADARADLMRARHRLSRMLLRHGRVFEARAWTRAHDAWLRRQRLEEPAAQAALGDSHDAALRARLRRDRLDAAIGEPAGRPDLARLVGRLACLRGVGTLTAVALAVEIGDWHRLAGASIGASLGLTPSGSQSGARHRRGPITKTGDSHARRLLVEAAWHQASAAGKRRARAPPRRRPARGGRPRRGGRGAPSPPLGPPGDPPRPALDDRGGGRRARAGGLVLEPRRDGRLRSRPRAWARRARRTAG